MGWRLKVNFSDGSEELEDEVFESREDAEDEWQGWLDGWGSGRETLKLAGESYSEKDLVNCEIWEE
jgi:hypothetical protein